MEPWPENAPDFGAVERRTREQSSNWLMERRGKVTSTWVKRVCSSTDDEKLAAEMKNPRNISHLSFVARGQADEQAGVDYLLQVLGGDAKAYRIGLVIHPDHSWLAASPDRLLYYEGEWHLVEIKNWYETKRQRGLKDLPYLDKQQQLRKTHSYYYQVQTALAVTQMKTCYFVVHGTEKMVQKVHLDENKSAEIILKTKVFYEKNMQTDRL